MRNLSSIKFATPSDLVAGRLLDWQAAGRGGGTAAWGVANERGVVTQDMRAGAVCNSQTKLGSDCEWVIGLRTASSARDPFFDNWLLRESFAAPFIQLPTDRGFVLSGDLPANLLVAILTVQRIDREFPAAIAEMKRLVEKFGVTSDVAFFLTFGLSGFGVSNHNHNILGARGDIRAYALNYLARDAVTLLRPANQTKEYRSINAMWGDGDMCPPAMANVKAAFPATVEIVGDRVVVPNPFKPIVKSPRGHETWSKEAFDEAVPFIVKQLERNTHDNPMRRAA